MKHNFMNKENGKTATVLAMYLDDDGDIQTDHYDKVEDLMEDYAAYKPAKPEPLIKDEKIRKAVRVWLESWKDTPDNWQYWEQDYEEFHIARGDVEIFFPVSNGSKAGWYTIAELCGEEE